MKTVFISIGIVLILAFLFTVAISFLVKLSKNKKINVDNILEETQTGLETAETIAAAITPLFPQYAPILKTILYYVSKFVDQSEALWKANTNGTGIDRKAVAIADITAALKAAGFTVDNDMAKFIDSTVEMYVRSLPKSHTAEEVPASTMASENLTSSTDTASTQYNGTVTATTM